ncbi:HEAT repeat-containing protein 1 homolog [Aedes albopictus]|uniref:HEAT repeat-containing protein 1 n=1 Tax=Aedes albopictus TaxID=7160 RepID=A0ABM1YCV7_AEDAL|nr:HEAT repeat-containing protein 1 homolog [Aedes albopictus]
MATSLAAQLQRLAAPQTSLLYDKRKQPSILFDASQAASKDREVIYDIGISGLHELIQLNSAFAQFEDTLFDKTSIDLQRLVENKELNQKLDTNIRKFFFHVSPYFLLQPAHKCLEWLIRRFQIHEFNREDFVRLILPYHETLMFVRCVQILAMPGKNDPLYWLSGVKKSGSPLAKKAIINHAVGYPGFLRSYGEFLERAVQELDSKANVLQAMIAFYCTITIGVLDAVDSVNENLVTSILKTLTKGLNSKAIDFTAACYMIIGHLVTKASLAKKALETFLTRLCVLMHPSLEGDAAMVMVLITDTQKKQLGQFSDSLVASILGAKWLPFALARIKKDGVNVTPLFRAILEKCLKKICQQDEQLETYEKFCEGLLLGITLDANESEAIIQCVLDSYFHKSNAPVMNAAAMDDKSSEIISLDSEEEDFERKDETVTRWYSAFLRRLETQYPTAFDNVVKRIMKGQGNFSQNKRNALRNILGFLTQASYNENDTNIFESLFHYDADRRTDAVRYLVDNFQNISLKGDGNCELLKDSIKERLNDDNWEVVAEVLKLDTADLIKLIGKDELIDKLIKISLKCMKDLQRWEAVTSKVIDVLTDKRLYQGTNLNKIIIALYPFLFPSEDDELGAEIAQKVLASDFSRKHNILMLSMNKMDNVDCESILDTLEAMLGEGQNFHSIQVCFNVLLVASSLPQDAPVALATRVFNFVIRLLSGRFKYAPSSSLSCLKYNRLPMDIHVIATGYLIDRVRFAEEGQNYSRQSASFSLQLKIFGLLTEKYFSMKAEHGESKKVFGKEISKFLKRLYPQSEQRVEFLTSFYAAHLVEGQVTGSHMMAVQSEMQVRTFRLLNAMLMQVDFNLNPDILANVLLGLTSELSVIRECALKTLEIMCSGDRCTLDPPYKSFLKKLLKRREELAMDGEQLSLVMFTVFSYDRNGKLLGNVLADLVNKINREDTPEYVAAGLLDILKLLDDEDIFVQVVGRGVRILKRAASGSLDVFESRLLKSLVARINPNTSRNLTRDDRCREFVHMALQNHLPLRCFERKHVSTSILMIEAISEELFATFSEAHAAEIIKLVVEAATLSQNPETNSAAGKLFKGLKLDVSLVLDILESMKVPHRTRNEKRKSRASLVPTDSVFSSTEWKCGVTLLELLQNKKQFINKVRLIPKLFEILKFCLDFEEQSGVEYVKQMILSLLFNCCVSMEGKPEKDSSIAPSTFKVELIVQCIRATQNPQTHHHALLLLAHVAHLVPDQVLHNMMEIFTFMGSSIVRHDDVYSIQIISKIIETIIPTLAMEKSGKKEEKVVPILKIFSDVIMDVPEHRRIPLYTKLIETLGATEHLWMFLGVLLESDVMKGGKKADLDSSKKRHKVESTDSQNFSKRLEIGMNIAREFEPRVVMETCNQLLQYIMELPVQIETKEDRMEVDITDNGIFSVASHTNKELRHYRYSTSAFVAALIRSTEIINKIALLDEKETDAMRIYYRELIVSSLAYINVVAKIVEKARSENDQRELNYWEVALTKCYEILDGIVSLLAPMMMITVFGGLLKHRLLIIRMRVIDIFNKKLQYEQSYFDESHHPKLLDLLGPLLALVRGILTEENVVGSHSARYKIAQEAYLSFKHLSKLLAHKYPAEFKAALTGLVEELHDYKKDPNSSRLASLILCIGEVSVNVGAHSIPFLPKYIPMLTKFVAIQVQKEEPFDILTSSIVTSILKIVDSLSRFLSPYLKSIIVGIAKLHAKLGDSQDPRLTNISNRLAQIWEKLGSNVPLRLLIPAIEDSYSTVVKDGSLDAIGPLMKLLSNSFNSIQTSEFNTLQSELADFFLSALQFRCDNSSSAKFLPQSVDIAEEHVIKAFVVLILKLSESTFRPLYYKVFEWANRDTSTNDRAITFFNLSSHVAEALKHLFVLFASELITNAARLLDATNAAKTTDEEDLFFPVPSKNVTLIRYILRTLFSILVHDNQNFINSVRFDTLLQPIVDQMENTLVFEDNEIRGLVVNCLAQMAVAVADDTLWRQLNHQVLLKTRNNDPEIRLFALEACTELARKIGENFAPLLPETIPFLAELLEDENQAVEKAVQKTVREVEKVTGEPLHKYL